MAKSHRGAPASLRPSDSTKDKPQAAAEGLRGSCGAGYSHRSCIAHQRFRHSPAGEKCPASTSKRESSSKSVKAPSRKNLWGRILIFIAKPKVFNGFDIPGDVMGEINRVYDSFEKLSFAPLIFSFIRSNPLP